MDGFVFEKKREEKKKAHTGRLQTFCFLVCESKRKEKKRAIWLSGSIQTRREREADCMCVCVISGRQNKKR